jgi:alkylation response protein AidB-like acyl-CoA dehydrogenase
MNEEEHKLGIRASSTRQVFFNETKVPAENMLSDRGNGFKIAMNVKCWTYQFAAACLDAQRRVITNAGLCKRKSTFNTPIAQFGAIRSKLADMATSCYAEKALLQGSKDIEDRIIAQAEGMFIKKQS